MRFIVLFLLFASMPIYGQARDGRSHDTGDIMNFLIQSQIVDFKPNLNRDPFTVPSDLTSQKQGMLVDEIIIKGRIVVRKKPFAIILDSYQQARELPVGYQFLDGEITAITENAVVFNQWDANSAMRAGSRTVTKYFKREEDR